jgi:hypothetical protein
MYLYIQNIDEKTSSSYFVQYVKLGDAIPAKPWQAWNCGKHTKLRQITIAANAQNFGKTAANTQKLRQPNHSNQSYEKAS